ncbi:MAG TPA: hypothetical protein VIT90_10290 [Lysobacter sp.]
MSENPYAAPGAVLSDAPVTGSRRLYSPAQVAAGAFVGGPVGVIYFLWTNFRALANHRAAQRTLMIGALLLIALSLVLPLLPEKFPSLPFTIAYVLVARHIAEKQQMTKQAILESGDYTLYSNWRVFGLALVCVVFSFVLMLAPLVVLATLGIWDPLGLI